MPIDSSIYSQSQQSSPLNALASGYQLGNTIRQQPMQDKLNQQKLDAGQVAIDNAKIAQQDALHGMAKSSLQSDYYGAMQIAPYVASGDIGKVSEIINQRKSLKQQLGAPTDSEDNFLAALQSNPEQAKKGLAQVIAVGDKLFGRAQQQRSVALNPGGQLYDAQGNMLAENSNTKPGTGSLYGNVIWKQGADNSLTPIQLGKENGIPTLGQGERWVGTPSTMMKPEIEQLMTPIKAEQAQAVAAGTSTGKKYAQRQAQYEDWTAFQKSFGEAYPDINALMQSAPGSSISNVINTYGSKLIGGTGSYEAQAKIEQLGSILLQQVPFPPGAQSEAEQRQREKTLGKLEDPNISPDTKLDMISRFVRMNEAKFRELANNPGGQLPNGNVPPPAGMPATPENMNPNNRPPLSSFEGK